MFLGTTPIQHQRGPGSPEPISNLASHEVTIQSIQKKNDLRSTPSGLATSLQLHILYMRQARTSTC